MTLIEVSKTSGTTNMCRGFSIPHYNIPCRYDSLLQNDLFQNEQVAADTPGFAT